jgi:alkaline phosphatase D
MEYEGRRMRRRNFLKTLAFTTFSAAAAGCAARKATTPSGGAFVFPQGVASGDPRPNSVVLWTRIMRRGKSVKPVDATVEVSRREDFREVIVSSPVTADAAFDYTIRHKVTNLAPGETYYYRFLAGGDVSPIGRTWTAPAEDADLSTLRFAVLTCQDYSVNHWSALERVAQEDVHFIVHLGDYIYETVGSSFQKSGAEPAHPPLKLPDGAPTPNQSDGVHAVTLRDYRHLYKTYRSDARLQALHARAPVIAVWDDHEFSNDCWREHSTYVNENPAQLARRRSATQAWFEYMPADVPFDPENPSHANIQLYRDFRFGRLAHLIMTDERLHRSDHAVTELSVAASRGRASDLGGDDSLGSRNFVDRDAVAAAEAKRRTDGNPVGMLGDAQEAWWMETVAKSSATWKLWGNEVSLLRMQFDLRALAPAPFNRVFLLNSDQWDGYNEARKRLMAFLKERGVKNLVAFTGDIHGFFAGQVLDDFDAESPTPVMVDVASAGVSSRPIFYDFKASVETNPLFARFAPLVLKTNAAGRTENALNDTLRRMNPWLKFVDTQAIGYTLVEVSPEKIAVQCKKFHELSSDGSAPSPALDSITSFTIPRDAPEIVFAEKSASA